MVSVSVAIGRRIGYSTEGCMELCREVDLPVLSRCTCCLCLVTNIPLQIRMGLSQIYLSKAVTGITSIFSG